ncbi:MAG: hypothetical protein CK431_04335 [Mycobacterium sp.]|nr:MAG: hypothetical protein CK431_04335 [Mycobacterium sp.]
MFAYAPKIYRDYLRPLLDDDIRITGDVPATRPPRLVTVRLGTAPGSRKPRLLAWRRLVFQMWDVDEMATGALAEQVRDLVVNSVYARIGARQVRVFGEPARLDDPDDRAPRFQMTADVLFRANREP